MNRAWMARQVQSPRPAKLALATRVRRDYRSGRITAAEGFRRLQRIYPRLDMGLVGWANLLLGDDDA